MQLLLKGGRLIDPVTGRDETVDIHCVNGVIERLAPSVSAPAAQVIDLRGKIVAPGFIDMHVHLREPGFEYKETIETGCRAAAAGGFTAVCCMPNTNPPIDDASVVRFIQSRAKSVDGGIVDVYPVGAVTVGRKGEQLAPLAELAEAGAVAFTDDGDPVHNAEIMRRALEYAAMYDRPIIQHAQDVPMTRNAVMNEGAVATALGLAGWPSVAEDVVVARDVRLAQYTGGRYHVAHISTSGATDIVREAKKRQIRVTAEVTPHHILLTEEAVRGYSTNTKMNPPLRTREDVDALREALRDGTIDVIATDHAPHSFDEKEVEFSAAPFGIVGLETAVGIVLNELFRKNVLSLFEIVQKLSVNPRKILRLPDVKIEPGVMANLTIFDPAQEWTVDTQAFRSRSKNSPFGGLRLTGRPVGVLNNGQASWTA